MADNSHTLMTGNADLPNAVDYKWCKVISVYGDGRTNNTDGSDPIVLNDEIPTGAILSEIRSSLQNPVNDVKSQIIEQIFSYKTFGLRYDFQNRQWRLVTENNQM